MDTAVGGSCQRAAPIILTNLPSQESWYSHHLVIACAFSHSVVEWGTHVSGYRMKPASWWRRDDTSSVRRKKNVSESDAEEWHDTSQILAISQFHHVVTCRRVAAPGILLLSLHISYIFIPVYSLTTRYYACATEIAAIWPHAFAILQNGCRRLTFTTRRKVSRDCKFLLSSF
jgi:hypothetical protein